MKPPLRAHILWYHTNNFCKTNNDDRHRKGRMSTRQPLISTSGPIMVYMQNSLLFHWHWYRLWYCPEDSPKPEVCRLMNDNDLTKLDQLNQLSLHRFVCIDDDLWIWQLKRCKLVRESSDGKISKQQSWESFFTSYDFYAEIELASPLGEKTNDGTFFLDRKEIIGTQR